MKNQVLNKAQIRELIQGLKLKEIPLKLEYLGKGAKRWDWLIRSIEYGLGKTESDLIKENLNLLKRLARNQKSVILFDLGCGNGSKIIPLVKEFKKEATVNIFLVDFSKQLLKIAKNNIKKDCKILQCNTVICDLEKNAGYSKIAKIRNTFSTSLAIYFLLGNTLGNFTHPQTVLSFLRAAMKKNDLLIIGTELNNDNNEKNLTQHYQNNRIFNIQFSRLEAIGVNKKDGKFVVQFNKSYSQVETYFVFSKQVLVKLGNERINFCIGDKVLLMTSKKYTIAKLEDIINKNKFATKKIFRNKNYCLIQCEAR